jgi:hypothetical protein
MNPGQHGEVFVLSDGGEVDLLDHHLERLASGAPRNAAGPVTARIAPTLMVSAAKCGSCKKRREQNRCNYTLHCLHFLTS